MILLSLSILVLGGFFCVVLGRSQRSRFFGAALNIAGCFVCAIPATLCLFKGIDQTLQFNWSIPMGSFALRLDPLAAFFLLLIVAASGLSALYGFRYLKHFETTKNLGSFWFFYNLLTASMILVVLADNAILFLAAWESMSLASFFLVAFEKEKDVVRRSAWTYLVATHLGTAFLLVMFILLQQQTGTLNLHDLCAMKATGSAANVLFVLALLGFGTKAGFMPLHVWLPEAHPSAPSPVSAVMSGVMIKTGIYGLVRTLSFLGAPPAWWGWSVVVIGIVSGIMGVLFAIAQHDLKRLLAYHSVENIGIIALGLGIGLLGITYHHGVMAFAGFLGALLHVMNHGIFKTLLFLSAGSVLHSTGTREMDHLGGLMKKMPVTATAFLTGSIAICGLPPLNGFVSEFLIYYGALGPLIASNGVPIAEQSLCVLAISSLALIGGLAAACFTKAYGVVFLGEPRSEHGSNAHEAGWPMLVPMIVLAGACLALGVSGPFLVSMAASVVSPLLESSGLISEDLVVVATRTGEILWRITLVAAVLLVLAALLLKIRSLCYSRKKIASTVTWDCGYVAPTPRMQYTSSSFVQLIVLIFLPFLRTRRRFTKPEGFFPESADFSTYTPDFYREHFYGPIFASVESALSRFRWIQHGRLNLYVLSIVLALILLLAWKIG